MKRSFVLLCFTVGCSWTQFDKFETDTPVTSFSNRAFGSGVGIATDKNGKAVLGTSGNPGDGARFFPLLDGTTEPSTSPITNNAQCELTLEASSVGKACLSAPSPIGVGTLVDPAGMKEHTGCFAVGYGKQGDAAELSAGPTVFCTDSFLFTLGGAPADSNLSKAFANRNLDDIRAQKIAIASLPADGATNPPLVLGVETDEAAFAYPTIAAGQVAQPLLGAAATKGDRFGAAVAIAKYAGSPMYLVSAPAIGKIFAYVNGATPTDPPVHVGCIEGATGLGETLAVGDVDGDGQPDVLAREGVAVKIFKGSGRPTTPSATDCANKWDTSSVITLTCAEVRGASDCANGDFGRSIAAGDFDGDGKTDVAIGAPYAAAEGLGGSGAVFLFTPASSTNVLDVRYLGQPSGDAGFGWAVASGKVGTQDTLAVGARGKGLSYVVWCTGLPGSPQNARCRK
ncbi:MAG: FG-GAP repeat protein [Polyangiales bacterium]